MKNVESMKALIAMSNKKMNNPANPAIISALDAERDEWMDEDDNREKAEFATLKISEFGFSGVFEAQGYYIYRKDGVDMASTKDAELI